MTVHASWREAAACRDADPDVFFPVGTAGPALRQIEEAKRICRACPAQAPVNDRARRNMAYVRRLLRHRQPGFAAALESAVMLAERELTPRTGDQVDDPLGVTGKYPGRRAGQAMHRPGCQPQVPANG